MKTTFTFTKCLYAALLLFAVSSVTAQTLEVQDGGTLNIQGSATPYSSLTISSSTASNSSTAIVNSIANGSEKTVTLGNGCDFTSYYGLFNLDNGTTFDFQKSASATIPCKFNVDNSYTETTTLKLTCTSSGVSFTGYDGSSRSLILGNYGVLDLTGSTNDITFAKSIYLNGYTANAPYIKYVPAGALSSLPKLIISGTNETFTSSGTSDAIYASKHFSVDLANATASSLNSTAYPLVQLTEASTAPTIAAGDLTPTITGNSDGAWTIGDMTVTNPGGNTQNVNFVATYNPLFTLDATAAGYARDWNAMASQGTEGIMDNAGYLQTLRKTATTGFGATVSKSLSIDLGTYTLAGPGQTFTISSGKGLAFKRGSGGTFDGQIQFGSSASYLVFLGTGVTDAIFGANFSGSSSSSSGFLQIGDGTTTSSYTHSLASVKISSANKISKIVVSNGSTLTVTQ